MLRRLKVSLLNRMILFAFIIGLVPATYPLYTYIDDHNFERPILLVTAMACLHGILLIRSYSVIAAYNKITNSTSTNYTLLGSWRDGLRLVWKWHIAFGILRFGLVIGLSQLFHSSLTSSCYEYGLTPYCFWSCSGIGGLSYTATYTLIQASAALITILIYSVFEAALSSAIVTFVTGWLAWRSKKYDWSVLVALILRLFIVACAILLYSLPNAAVQRYLSTDVHGHAVLMCEQVYEEAPSVRYAISDKSREQAIATITVENSIILPFTLIDNATLLGSDLMRHSWNWLAVLQRIPAVIGGLLLYVCLIWVLLSASVRK